MLRAVVRTVLGWTTSGEDGLRDFWQWGWIPFVLSLHTPTKLVGTHYIHSLLRIYVGGRGGRKYRDTSIMSSSFFLLFLLFLCPYLLVFCYGRWQYTGDTRGGEEGQG